MEMLVRKEEVCTHRSISIDAQHTTWNYMGNDQGQSGPRRVAKAEHSMVQSFYGGFGVTHTVELLCAVVQASFILHSVHGSPEYSPIAQMRTRSFQEV